MRLLLATILLSVCVYNNAQSVGKQTPEVQPKFTIQECLKKGDCKPKPGTLTIDANWRWVHNDKGTNCYKGNLWDKTICPDGDTCTKNCVVDGADYKSTYGVSSTEGGDGATLTFVTNGPYSQNIGSRLYFLDGQKYHMFKLKNKEFSFDVDVSKLDCGLNGALYFAAMDEDGGMSKHPTNKAGAFMGVGYCDAQCPQDLKFINGKANSDGWIPDKNDPNTGTGHMGSCCTEMDIWEANSISQAFTPHTCSVKEPTMCLDKKCGNTPDTRYDSVCDKDGCDFASYRWGAREFYGPSKTVDTTKKFTVTTQFITSGNTDTGELVEIRRLYIQDGKTIKNEAVTFKGLAKPADSITQGFCDATKTFTGDKNDFKAKGGMKAMGDAMDKGMVLVLSLWDDKMANMQWLDGTYPPGKPNAPGAKRGTCDPASGKPETVRKEHPDATVQFSNVKIGPIGSTTDATAAASPATPKGKEELVTPTTSGAAAAPVGSATPSKGGNTSKKSKC